MSSLFLTDKQLVELTGAKRPSKQIEILSKNRLRFVTTLEGKPKIFVAWINQAVPVDSRPKPEFINVDTG